MQRVASKRDAQNRPPLTLKVGDTLTVQSFDTLPCCEGVIVEVDDVWRVYRVTIAIDETCCTPETAIPVDGHGNIVLDM